MEICKEDDLFIQNSYVSAWIHLNRQYHLLGHLSIPTKMIVHGFDVDGCVTSKAMFSDNINQKKHDTGKSKSALPK